MRRPIGLVILAALAGLALAACGTASKSPDRAQAGGQAGGQTGAMTAGIDSGAGAGFAPWEDPTRPIYRRTIYFRYDRSEILPEYVSLLRSHADFLAKHPRVRMAIQGHADERGTREYNLALGYQRAAAVKTFLVAEGVAASQLETMSYGEEKPARPGHGEASWSLNRRAELDYRGP